MNGYSAESLNRRSAELEVPLRSGEVDWALLLPYIPGPFA
jgi:hypothetical protein